MQQLSLLCPIVIPVIFWAVYHYHKDRHLPEPLDGIIYASFVGLGYAAVENWQYLDYLIPIEAYARGFASPVIHMLFASIWGYWVGCAYLQGRSLIIAAIAGLAIAASLHGLYDFIVILSPHNSLLIAAAGIVAIWVWRLKLMHKMHEDASQDL